MRPAQSADRLGLGLAYRPWHHLRRVRTLLQSLRAELKIAPPPLVRRFAADAEVLAQLAHAFLFGRQRRHQPHLLVHRTDLPPRHRLTPPAVAFNLLPILPVYSVTYPAGLFCYLSCRSVPPPQPSPKARGRESERHGLQHAGFSQPQLGRKKA